MLLEQISEAGSGATVKFFLLVEVDIVTVTDDNLFCSLHASPHDYRALWSVVTLPNQDSCVP